CPCRALTSASSLHDALPIFLSGGPKGTLESPVAVLLLSSEGPLLGTGRDRAPNRGLGWQVHPRRQDQGSPFQWSISPDRGIRARSEEQRLNSSHVSISYAVF